MPLGFSVLPKSANCSDCSAPILKSSVRCRACNLKRVGAGGWNRIGDAALSNADRTARYRAKHPERAKAASIEWKRDARHKVAAYKSERGCEDCGTTDARVLDLHHRDGEEKVMAVSQMLNRRSWSAVKAEIDKCRVLCANCHRIEHSSEDDRSDITAQINAAGFFRAS
jgi:hypothetical protein